MILDTVLDTSEALQCSICSEDWTDNDAHRVVSLKCGHMFGESCILRWIHSTERNSGTVGRGTCPICICSIRECDLRPLQYISIAVQDETETGELREKLNDALQKSFQLQKAVEKYTLSIAMCHEQLKQQTAAILTKQPEEEHVDEQHKIAPLNGIDTTSPPMSSVEPILSSVGCYQEMSILRFSNEQSARVMALLPNEGAVIVGMKHLTLGHSLQKIDMATNHTSQLITHHTNTIRDIKSSVKGDTYLLSTGLDKTLVLTNVQQERQVQSYALESPGWSCAFDDKDPNTIYCGLFNGFTLVYDIRKASHPVYRMKRKENPGPIYSLSSASNDQGAVIFCGSTTSPGTWTTDRCSDHEPQYHPFLPTSDMQGYSPYSMIHHASSNTVLLSRRHKQATLHTVGHMKTPSTFVHQWTLTAPFPQPTMARTTLWMHPHHGMIVCYGKEESGGMCYGHTSRIDQPARHTYCPHSPYIVPLPLQLIKRVKRE
ncbi:hypothetical protein BDF14DRAFT_1796533 [Spinellus fusiger]|nr:hypothetical protein BDF14DRAFT_1796533 [Spinellus fusiger]